MPASNQRQHILSTAVRLVGEIADPRGLAMADVAAAAGVGRATLYRYFKDRSALLRAVAEATGVPPPVTNSRAQILEAALVIFGERGIHAATLREIAARAGLTLSGLHWHFRNKQELIAALADHIPVLPAIRAVAAAPEAADLETQLTQIAPLMLGMMREHGPMLRLAICEAGVYPDVAQLAARYTAGEALRTLARVFEGHERFGKIRPGPAPIRAQAFMGMMSTLAILRPALGDAMTADDEACAREFVQIMVRGVLADPQEV
jgi:AcrR family transcriptional regulator